MRIHVYIFIQTHDSDYIPCSCILIIHILSESQHLHIQYMSDDTSEQQPPGSAIEAVDTVGISDDSQATENATVPSKRQSKPMKPFQQWGLKHTLIISILNTVL